MSGRVVVVGLGPAGPDLLTAAARHEIDRIGVRYVRTARHPAAAAVPDAIALDHHYEHGFDFDAVYSAIVDDLVGGAVEHGEVLYAVPGSPAVAERTVEMLRGRADIDVLIVPAVSFCDLAWDRLGVDPVSAGVRILDARTFAVDAAGERGPLLVAQCDRPHVLADVKAAATAEPGPVTVLQRLGLPDEQVFEVAWDDLDRAVETDHLTSLWIPGLAAPVGSSVARFEELVARLRRDCPWDREQTHQTLTRHLLEESHEVLEAIESLGPDGEGDDLLEEELGDLLFQVVFHATLARERGAFTLADVADGIHDKLVGRHPHVFGDVEVDGADGVIRNWELIKKAEKGRASVFDGIPNSLPALLYALKVQKKADSLGLDAQLPDDVDGLGAALFALVDRARRDGIDPEAALRRAATAFRVAAEPPS